MWAGGREPVVLTSSPPPCPALFYESLTKALSACPQGPTDMSDLIQELEKAEMREDDPDFAPGDTVRVLYNVREGVKERIQVFEGICIARRGGGMGETFTVRKISSGVGVERVFPLHAPTVTGVEVVRRGRVRRAKLYYLRGLRGKAARIREKRTT